MGCRGTVDTEEQKVKRNSKYRGTEVRGTVGLEKLRNMGTEEQQGQRRSRHICPKQQFGLTSVLPQQHSDEVIYLKILQFIDIQTFNLLNLLFLCLLSLCYPEPSVLLFYCSNFSAVPLFKPFLCSSVPSVSVSLHLLFL